MNGTDRADTDVKELNESKDWRTAVKPPRSDAFAEHLSQDRRTAVDPGDKDTVRCCDLEGTDDWAPVVASCRDESDLVLGGSEG